MAPVKADPLIDSAAPFDGGARHCARMRPVELVVDYVPGPELSIDGVHVGAVYRAHPDAEEFFAQAEPPTHDDWVATHLSGTARGVVTAARTFVNTQLDETLSRYRSDNVNAMQIPLGSLATRLASFLPSATGTGAEGQVRERQAGGIFDQSIEVSVLKIPLRFESKRHRSAIYEFSPAAEIRTFTVEVSAVADGTEKPPIGAEVPEPIGWEAENGQPKAAMLTIGPDDPRKWAAVARAPADAVTRMTVKRVET